MIHELRTYRIMPGKAPAYLDLLHREGLHLVTRHLPLLGYWMVETGRLNAIHHLWAYESWAERSACRAALSLETAWSEGFISRAFPWVVEQETLFMTQEAGSPQLDRALAERGRERPAGTASTPLFAAECAALTFTEGEAPRDQIACWRVASGDRPGSLVALSPRSSEPAMAPSGAFRHEIIRPCGFSPL